MTGTDSPKKMGARSYYQYIQVSKVRLKHGVVFVLMETVDNGSGRAKSIYISHLHGFGLYRTSTEELHNIDQDRN